jgi:hypothetical protein
MRMTKTSIPRTYPHPYPYNTIPVLSLTDPLFIVHHPLYLLPCIRIYHYHCHYLLLLALPQGRGRVRQRQSRVRLRLRGHAADQGNVRHILQNHAVRHLRQETLRYYTTVHRT